jgi:hypothetical protein
MSERGGSGLTWVTVITLIMGLAASIYLNYIQGQRASENKQASSAQIADLTKRLESAERAVKANGGSDASVKKMTMSQLGATLDRLDPVSDLTYIYSQVNGDDVALFTTTSMLIQYPACTPGTALGKLVRRSSKSTDKSGKLIKAINGFGFYYIASGSGCATDSTGRQNLKDARAAMTNVVLPTLEAK